MAGRYNGSSAALPATTCVTRGSPKGSKAESITLPLRQVGAVVLAVTQLEQPLVADAPVPTGGRAIHSHPLRLQLVHPDETLVERGLKALPLLRLGQRVQHQRQPVTAPQAFLHLLAGTQSQRFHPLAYPTLDRVHLMI